MCKVTRSNTNEKITSQRWHSNRFEIKIVKLEKFPTNISSLGSCNVTVESGDILDEV